MKKVIPLLIILPFLAVFFIQKEDFEKKEQEQFTPTGRMAYELARLADPETGEIPPNIRQRELAYARKLPSRPVNEKSGSQVFKHIGPYNVGGRTRALAIDAEKPYIYFAGGVSGGLWKTSDQGKSWKKVSDPKDHAAVSCIVQDTRTGKTATWYYGSGESIGNSASKSFSAYYVGSGVWKSNDNGKTWQHLASTNVPVNKRSEWDIVYALAIDPSRNDSDIVYAALKRGIIRSNDGGDTWSYVLKASTDAPFTDVKVSSNGVVYATIGIDVNTVISGTGFFRSPDGLNWTRITDSKFPKIHTRTVFDIAPSNQNIVYFFSATPGAGAAGASLWKYEYKSGNGSGTGGVWENLSPNIPDSNLNLFGGYCMVLKVKPDNSDVIFLGGNNLYRTLTGFKDTINVQIVGGYKIFGDSTYNTRLGYQHPDQQNLAFHPTDPDILLSSTDGGVHRTVAAADTLIKWTSLNNGYVTSQFYGIGIDHGTSGSEVVLGGLQDQGTYWTNTLNDTVPWKSIRGSDGAYVAVEDGGGAYYLSTQYANIRRYILDSAGNNLHNKKVMPPSLPTGSGKGWLFVHPFTLDPVDNNIMYLPYKGEIWKNDSLFAADSGNLDPWYKLGSVGGTITAISASEAKQGDVIFGISAGAVYRIRNAHTPGTKTVETISYGITSKRYTSCIAIDPNDNNKIIVVYSNYNIISLWYTEDGGIKWQDIEGNLKGEKTDTLQPQNTNGPSCRWVEIIPTETGNRYFVGTSVGLFSTNELDGDNTVWMLEGENTIGNVVVDMLDYRHSDQFLAVGTHGNGIYTTNVIKNFLGDENISNKKDLSFRIFPNPVSSVATLEFELDKSMPISMEIIDMNGRKVMKKQNGFLQRGSHQIQIDMTVYKPGIYFISLQGENYRRYQRIVKN